MDDDEEAIPICQTACASHTEGMSFNLHKIKICVCSIISPCNKIFTTDMKQCKLLLKHYNINKILNNKCILIAKTFKKLELKEEETQK